MCTSPWPTAASSRALVFGLTRNKIPPAATAYSHSSSFATLALAPLLLPSSCDSRTTSLATLTPAEDEEEEDENENEDDEDEYGDEYEYEDEYEDEFEDEEG